MQGKWEIVSIESRAGKEEPGPGKMLCVITGDKILSKEGDASYTLDPSKKPRAIDVRGLSGDDKGKMFLGIYELNGPDLKMCVGAPNGARPTEFVPQANQSLILLRRLKN